MIRILVILIGVVLISCKSSKSIEHYQENQIEIDLMDQVSPKKMEIDFEIYGLKMICRSDRTRNIVVYEFDASFSTREVLIDLLGKEVGVESVTKTKGCIY